MVITQWTSTEHCVNFFLNQFAALKREREREREREGSEMGERDRLTAGEKNHLPSQATSS